MPPAKSYEPPWGKSRPPEYKSLDEADDIRGSLAMDEDKFTQLQTATSEKLRSYPTALKMNTLSHEWRDCWEDFHDQLEEKGYFTTDIDRTFVTVTEVLC
jgi:hypothetical protein